jgi:hypothetical protein
MSDDGHSMYSGEEEEDDGNIPQTNGPKPGDPDYEHTDSPKPGDPDYEHTDSPKPGDLNYKFVEVEEGYGVYRLDQEPSEIRVVGTADDNEFEGPPGYTVSIEATNVLKNQPELITGLVKFCKFNFDKLISKSKTKSKYEFKLGELKSEEIITNVLDEYLPLFENEMMSLPYLIYLSRIRFKPANSKATAMEQMNGWISEKFNAKSYTNIDFVRQEIFSYLQVAGTEGSITAFNTAANAMYNDNKGVLNYLGTWWANVKEKVMGTATTPAVIPTTATSTPDDVFEKWGENLKQKKVATLVKVKDVDDIAKVATLISEIVKADKDNIQATPPTVPIGIREEEVDDMYVLNALFASLRVKTKYEYPTGGYITTGKDQGPVMWSKEVWVSPFSASDLKKITDTVQRLAPEQKI